MEAIHEWFIAPILENGYLARSLFAGCLVAVGTSVIGCLIILRRMAFLGDAIAHSMLAGVVSGYLLMKLIYGEDAHLPAMIIGALLAGFATVLLVGFVSRVSRIKDDTAIGIMYTGIFALGGVLASRFSAEIHIDLLHFIVGDVLAVDADRLWMMACVSAITLLCVILFFRQLVLTTFDPIMAASIGIPVTLVSYLLTMLTSLVVVSAVNIVGVILVVGLLVTPAATAYLLSNRMSHMMMLAAVFGVAGIVGGVYLSVWLNVATGPMIVLFSTLVFTIVLVAAPRYGLVARWVRRWQMIPQTLTEDILGCLRRDESASTSMATMTKHVSGPSGSIRSAVAQLVKQGLVHRQAADSYVLTELGEIEARRLMRSHRIWETYLQRVGTPSTEIHDRAHILEHLHDEGTVDYLDDRLGHPLTDPHGNEIPEDFIHLIPGSDVNASLLREGHVAIVQQVSEELADRFQVGDQLTAGPRRDDNETWTFKVSGGEEVSLNHEQADQIIVRLPGSPIE